MRARAMAARCCWPPESLLASLRAWSLRSRVSRWRISFVFDLGAGQALEFESGDHDVLQHGEFGQEVVELEDETDMLVTEGGKFVLGLSGHGFIIDDKTTLIIGVHGGEDVEQSGFAAPGFADEGKKLALAGGKADVFQDLEPLRFIEIFYDVVDLE